MREDLVERLLLTGQLGHVNCRNGQIGQVFKLLAAIDASWEVLARSMRERVLEALLHLLLDVHWSLVVVWLGLGIVLPLTVLTEAVIIEALRMILGATVRLSWLLLLRWSILWKQKNLIFIIILLNIIALIEEFVLLLQRFIIICLLVRRAVVGPVHLLHLRTIKLPVTLSILAVHSLFLLKVG